MQWIGRGWYDTLVAYDGETLAAFILKNAQAIFDHQIRTDILVPIEPDDLEELQDVEKQEAIKRDAVPLSQALNIYTLAILFAVILFIVLALLNK